MYYPQRFVALRGILIMSVTRDEVIWAYRMFLGREPESEDVVRLHMKCENLLSLREEFIRAPEFLLVSKRVSEKSIFVHYNTNFDAVQTMLRHAAPNLVAREGYLTNFLGVVIDPKFFPTILEGRSGQVEGIPIPANWHADIAEWASALRAVDLARGAFTVIELGCGWGCWMNNTGVAARRAGLDVHMIGIEGDEGHIGFAHEALRANGFRGSQFTLHRGVAAAAPGIALFPRQNHAGVEWGLEPIFGASKDQRRRAIASGSHDELPMIPLAKVVEQHPRIDLLHVDIQGGEADLIAGCLPTLSDRIAYLVIGTHSRQIEGRLFDSLLQKEWRLEMERPALLSLANGVPIVTVDGVQGWRNMKLLPD
jgi:FkbM family methyltransferase